MMLTGFSFRPCAKIIMVCNRRPDLDAYDEALRRRIRVIPFDHQVSEHRQDPDLVDKLTGELPGILNRLAIAGVDFVANSATPDAVLTATQGYLVDKDHIAAFLDERTEKKPGANVSKSYLYNAYKEWCTLECLPCVGLRELTRVMKKKGYEEGRTTSARGWKDLWVGHVVETHETIDDDMSWYTGAAANTA